MTDTKKLLSVDKQHKTLYDAYTKCVQKGTMLSCVSNNLTLFIGEDYYAAYNNNTGKIDNHTMPLDNEYDLRHLLTHVTDGNLWWEDNNTYIVVYHLQDKISQIHKKNKKKYKKTVLSELSGIQQGFVGAVVNGKDDLHDLQSKV